MSPPNQIWICPKCSAEVDAGFEVCWACGTRYDGTSDPNFEVATAPIVETDHVDPPSPWAALFLLWCLPALVLYGVVKLAFPLRQRQLGPIIRSLLLVLCLLLVGFLLLRWIRFP